MTLPYKPPVLYTSRWQNEKLAVAQEMRFEVKRGQEG